MSRRVTTRPGPVTGDRLAANRERFLTAEPVEPNQVRETILASWWRSRRWHVAADRIYLSYVRDPYLDTPLTRSAVPVLRQLRESLEGRRRRPDLLAQGRRSAADRAGQDHGRPDHAGAVHLGKRPGT